VGWGGVGWWRRPRVAEGRPAAGEVWGAQLRAGPNPPPHDWRIRLSCCSPVRAALAGAAVEAAAAHHAAVAAVCGCGLVVRVDALPLDARQLRVVCGDEESFGIQLMGACRCREGPAALHWASSARVGGGEQKRCCINAAHGRARPPSPPTPTSTHRRSPQEGLDILQSLHRFRLTGSIADALVLDCWLVADFGSCRRWSLRPALHGQQ
jgi:hypothetical protein